MRFKRFFMQYGLSQTLLLSFAFANALLPPGYITVFIVIYILIFGALMYYFTRKMIKGRVKDIDVVRLMRRCDKEEEAIEIIEYLTKRGEISKEHAVRILKQLKEKGLRSFGSKITWGFFEREYRRNF